MRKLLLNPTPLFRKLRQLSMLLTLLLALPLSVFGKGYRTTGNVTDVTAGYNAGTRFTWNTNATETSTWQWVINCEAETVTPDISTLTFTLPAGKNITMNFGGSANSTNADWSNLRKFTFDGLSDELTVSAALTQGGNTYNFTGSNGVFTPSGDTESIDMNGVLNVTITNNSENSVTCTINSITVLTGQIISSNELVWPTDSPINELTKSVSNNVTTLSGNCAANTSFSFPLKRDEGNSTLSTLTEQYDIAYSSSNPSVAEVSNAGFVTIKGYGSTTITATLTENDYYSYEQSTYSYTLTNTESYGLTIAGTAVTSANASAITGTDIYGNVSYDATTNTLTLNGATINGGIVYSGAGNLTIALKGTNNIGDNSTSIATGISSTNNGTLTFTVDGSGGSLSINTTTSAVSGFADVTLGTGTYLYVGNPTKYDTNGKNFREQIGSANIVKVMQITSQAYYPLWVNGAQVSHLTPNTNLTFTAATNTLALSNAWIAPTGIISGLDNLIITLTGNNTIQLSDTTAAIRSINPAATLTIQKSASAENGSLNMKNNVDDASSSPVIKNFASVSHTGLNFVSKTGTTLEAATVHDAVLSSAEIYPLWIGGTLVTAATHSFNGGTSGTIDYSSETNTLTLTGYQNTFATGHAIETGIVGLKVKLVGDNYITCQDNSGFAFYTQQSTASVQFTKVDATSKLTMTTNGDPISGFGDGKVTYDGLVYYSSGGSEKYITQPKAPTLGWEIKNDEKGQSYTYATIKYALTDRVGGVESGALFYASQNPVLKYSFDYANDAIADVTDETYPAGGIKMIAPGKLTAWVEVGTAKSEESKGVRFGILENPVEMEFDGVARTIDFTPAPTMTNAVTLSVNSDYTTSFNSFATLDATNNKITINSCYDGMIGFTFTNTDGGYTSLNDTTKITFNVTPPKPTISVPGGTYDAAQTVSIVSNYQGTATIKYYFEPTAEQTYSADLSITTTQTLTAWVEVNGVKSDTVQAPYTIRQAANLSYSAETATAQIAESGTTFTAPTLNNPLGINDITYSSSNEQVATISNTGNVTILGAGTTTISAKATDETIYTPTSASYVLTVTRNIINPFSDVMEGQNFATYYNDNEDLALPEGLTAYIVTGVSGTMVTITATGYLPKDVPLLLEKTGELAESLEMNGYSGEAGNFSSNKLKYVNLEAGETASGNEYVLYMNEFVKATGTIPQGKCYLDLTGVSGSRGMYGIGGDGSTGIQGIGREATENGQWYDLQGRRIQQPTKAGIYIVNGKKVIINKK